MRRVLVFLNETAAPANYTLSLHDALPISRDRRHGRNVRRRQHRDARAASLHEAGPARVPARNGAGLRSEPGAVPCRDTSRSGFVKGSGSSITVLTTPNIPAVAPIARDRKSVV